MPKTTSAAMTDADAYETVAGEAAESARESDEAGYPELAEGLWQLARKWRVEAIKLRALAGASGLPAAG